MMNAKVILPLALAAIATLLCVDVANADSLTGSRPNIILVMTDDQGMGDLSCMGNQVLRTPHLGRFYQDATRFTDFQVSPSSRFRRR